MALLKGTLEFDVSYLNELSRVFPSLGGRGLALLGKRGRTALKKELLSGQEITLRKEPLDSIGRRTITSDVNRRRDRVKIYSYPVNLFEKGRTLRDGSREPGKKIIGSKLKTIIMSRMGTYTVEIQKEIIDPELRRLEK